MKKYILFLLISLGSMTTFAQASSWGDFGISFALEKKEDVNALGFYFVSRPGITIEKCSYTTDSMTVIITGHYSYIVGVGFPTLVISRAVQKGAMEEVRYYFINFMGLRFYPGKVELFPLGMVTLNDDKPYSTVVQSNGLNVLKYYTEMPRDFHTGDMLSGWIKIKPGATILSTR